MSNINLPDFDALPKHADLPQGNAWGLWGPDDQLGSTFFSTHSLLNIETIH